MTEVDGRTRRYADFFHVAGPVRDDRPLLLVWGNSQADALRVALSTVADSGYRTVRVPPVHELVETDVRHVRRLAAETVVLVSQPVPRGYRGLPIGTDDLASLMSEQDAVLRWPVVRWNGLEPFSAIVRDPDEPYADPPLVPYHDLRTLAQAARSGAGDWDVELSAETIRQVAHDGLDVLRRRERLSTDVTVNDLLVEFGADAMYTINHPGNSVLVGLAQRVLDALGEPGQPQDPGRLLLGTTRSPREARVLEALDLPVSEARAGWQHAGRTWTAEDVRAAHLAWYALRPKVVQAGLAHHSGLIAQLGLDTG